MAKSHPTLISVLESRLPASLSDISIDHLRQKLQVRTQQLCQNTEISAHLVDLLTREVSVLQEELHTREIKERRNWAFRQLQLLTAMLRTHAIKDNEVNESFYLAKGLLNKMKDRLLKDPEYTVRVASWLTQGGTSQLRDQLLRPLGYQGDFIPEFNAFVRIDELGLKLKERKEAPNG